MKQFIIVTECRSNVRSLIPIANIAYIQDSEKGHEKDTYIRLIKEDDANKKYFFVKQTLDEIAMQLDDRPLLYPTISK